MSVSRFHRTCSMRDLVQLGQHKRIHCRISSRIRFGFLFPYLWVEWAMPVETYRLPGAAPRTSQPTTGRESREGDTLFGGFLPCQVEPIFKERSGRCLALGDCLILHCSSSGRDRSFLQDEVEKNAHGE